MMIAKRLLIQTIYMLELSRTTKTTYESKWLSTITNLKYLSIENKVGMIQIQLVLKLEAFTKLPLQVAPQNSISFPNNSLQIKNSKFKQL